MEHFYKNIDGWFDYQKLYSLIVNNANDNSHFVEVGAWKGRSTAYMIVEIINSNKNIKFDVIDTWEGSAAHINYDCIVNNTLYNEFLTNLKSIENFYTPYKMDSIKASTLYNNESLDFVFVDAEHYYENVYNDLINWWPKVKHNGVLAGHDYSDQVKSAVESFSWNINKKVYSAEVIEYKDILCGGTGGNNEDEFYGQCWFIVKF